MIFVHTRYHLIFFNIDFLLSLYKHTPIRYTLLNFYSFLNKIKIAQREPHYTGSMAW